jgi:hypothetical protein
MDRRSIHVDGSFLLARLRNRNFFDSHTSDGGPNPAKHNAFTTLVFKALEGLEENCFSIFNTASEQNEFSTSASSKGVSAPLAAQWKIGKSTTRSLFFVSE